MVFRRDSKVDAFQRQISALRHQLGGENDGETVTDLDRPLSLSRDTPYLSDYPDFPSTGLERSAASRYVARQSKMVVRHRGDCVLLELPHGRKPRLASARP